MVVDTFDWHIGSIRFRPYLWRISMLKYFMRYKAGWWILHIIAITLTFYLGNIVKF